MSLVATKRRNLKYAVHLVTYLDILGFRELISEESPNFISKAIRLVIEATAPDTELRHRYKENYTNFSDLIVHTVPVYSVANKKYKDGLVYCRVLDLLFAQTALIQEGLLLRGALTIGNIERTYGVLFGPALIAAYDLEREKAKYPRIILDPRLLEELKTNPHLRRHKYREEMEYLSPFLKTDGDGVVFIDYLGGSQSEFSADEYFVFLEAHKRLVEAGLADFRNEPRILPKYEWLRQYYNDTVRARLDANEHRTRLIR